MKFPDETGFAGMPAPPIGKGRPTPKREDQRRAWRAKVAEAREKNPNIRKLYEAFSPPGRTKRTRGNYRWNPTRSIV